MAGQLLEHVVKKADPGGNIVNAGPVELKLDGDRGLLGAPLDPAVAHGLRSLIPSGNPGALLAGGRGSGHSPLGKSELKSFRTPSPSKLRDLCLKLRTPKSARSWRRLG